MSSGQPVGSLAVLEAAAMLDYEGAPELTEEMRPDQADTTEAADAK